MIYMKIRENGVYRITVDERLSESLFRFLFSKLSPDVTSQSIFSTTNWSDEEAIYMTNSVNKSIKWTQPEKLMRWQVLPNSEQFKENMLPLWGLLKEGQVYIYGGFRLEKEKEGIVIKRDETWRIHRADLVPELDDYAKKLYFETVRRNKVAV